MGPWMRQMDLGSLSRSFPACVPRGRDRPRPGPASQEAGLERLACLPPRCPPGSAPPGLALADTSQGAWSQDTWGTRPRAAAARPSPNPCWGVYLRRSSSLFSLSLFFSLGVGTPWVPGAQGNPSLFVCGRRGPTPGSRVTAPAPLHCLPPLTLQPGVDGAEHRLLVHLWVPRGPPAAPRCAPLFPRRRVPCAPPTPRWEAESKGSAPGCPRRAAGFREREVTPH
ncbi:hypothetical protein ABFV05_013021 [Capra hircus]